MSPPESWRNGGGVGHRVPVHVHRCKARPRGGILRARKAAAAEGLPARVLRAALFEDFDSRGAAAFQDQLLSAMRLAFGDHRETGTETR